MTTNTKYNLGTRVRRVDAGRAGCPKYTLGICEKIIYSGPAWFTPRVVTDVWVRWIPATDDCPWLEEMPVSAVEPA